MYIQVLHSNYHKQFNAYSSIIFVLSQTVQCIFKFFIKNCSYTTFKTDPFKECSQTVQCIVKYYIRIVTNSSMYIQVLHSNCHKQFNVYSSVSFRIAATLPLRQIRSRIWFELSDVFELSQTFYYVLKYYKSFTNELSFYVEKQPDALKECCWSTGVWVNLETHS